MAKLGVAGVLLLASTVVRAQSPPAAPPPPSPPRVPWPPLNPGFGCEDDPFWFVVRNSPSNKTFSCQWLAANDPGCTRYPDRGQRRACRDTCRTCPSKGSHTTISAAGWRPSPDGSFELSSLPLLSGSGTQGPHADCSVVFDVRQPGSELGPFAFPHALLTSRLRSLVRADRLRVKSRLLSHAVETRRCVLCSVFTPGVIR